MKYLMLVATVLLALICQQAHAEKPQKFIDVLSKKIYQDCNGEEIVFHQSSTNLDPLAVGTLKLQRIDDIKIKSNLEELKQQITRITQHEPYGQCLVGSNGCERFDGNYDNYAGRILTCGLHQLSISVDNYYWDGNKIELPPNQQVFSPVVNGNDNKVIANMTQGDVSTTTIKTGDDSPVVNGNDSVQNNLSISFPMKVVAPVCVAFVMGLLWFLKKKRVNSKKS